MSGRARAEVPGMAGLVTARAFATVIDAQVACAVLQSAGLDASLRDEHVVSIAVVFSNAVPIRRWRRCASCATTLA
jgi:hypothetical protein